ncbi:MAG: hypothetical protein LBU79_09280 [Planctomycetota bacterium]|jgi:hypothetical protein|nr:hypothetical protein [Planctomycetota bacterium]
MPEEAPQAEADLAVAVGEGLEGLVEETPRASWRDFLAGKTGLIVILLMATLQGTFAGIMLYFKTGDTPLAIDQTVLTEALTLDLLGSEVPVAGIYQLINGPEGKRLTVGIDLSLILGQLPEERVEGAPRPNSQEQEIFRLAVTDMEPRIRSRVNQILQRIEFDAYASPNQVFSEIREEIKNYVNDQLAALRFTMVRPELDRRRVTEVLLPMFVRQSF